MRLYIFKTSKKMSESGMLVVAEESFDEAVETLKDIKNREIYPQHDELTEWGEELFFDGEEPIFHESEDTVPDGENYGHWVLHTVIDDLHWCDEPKSGMNHRHLQCVHRSKRGFIAGACQD